MMTFAQSNDPLHHSIQPIHRTVKRTALNFNEVAELMALLQD